MKTFNREVLRLQYLLTGLANHEFYLAVSMSEFGMWTDLSPALIALIIWRNVLPEVNMSLLANPCHPVAVGIQQNLPELFDIFGELGIAYQ